SRRRHTRFSRDWSSDVCSSDLQRFDLLRRIAHHNKTPFTRIQPFAITALADCHRWLPPVTLMNATHALPLLLERPAARERKAHCQDLDMHRLRSVEMVRSDFLP